MWHAPIHSAVPRQCLDVDRGRVRERAERLGGCHLDALAGAPAGRGHKPLLAEHTPLRNTNECRLGWGVGRARPKPGLSQRGPHVALPHLRVHVLELEAPRSSSTATSAQRPGLREPARSPQPIAAAGAAVAAATTSASGIPTRSIRVITESRSYAGPVLVVAQRLGPRGAGLKVRARGPGRERAAGGRRTRWR